MKVSIQTIISGMPATTLCLKKRSKSDDDTKICKEKNLNQVPLEDAQHSG